MSFAEELGLKHPVIQAPMAGVQGSALAIACSQVGALGSLPCAMLTPEKLNEELSTIQKAGVHGVNVNFFAHDTPKSNPEKEENWRKTLTPYLEQAGLNPADIQSGAGRAPFNQEMADILEKYRPKVVSFHFGLPSQDLLDRVKSWGSLILSSATTVEEAVFLETQGVDAVIAQGLEAGGHRGHFLSHDLTKQLGLTALLPQIKKAVDIPVIAAGGIASPHAVKAMLALGADLVQIGTTYLLCDEATTPPLQREALKSEAAKHTLLTNLFTGRPARGIATKFMQELGPVNPDVPDFPLATGFSGPLKAIAEQQGASDYSSFWAGQNTSGCKEISAAEMTKWLVSEI